MQNNQNKIDQTGWIILSALFLALAYSGWLSYKAIQWNVLEKLEATKLVLPTQAPAASPSATGVNKK